MESSPITKIKKKVKKFCKFFLNNLFSGKTLALLLGYLLYRRIKSMPIEVNTSVFLKFLNDSARSIKKLVNFNNSLIIFGTQDNKKYMCHYSTSNIDQFNEILIKNNISYNYISGLRAFVSNPLLQIFYLSALFWTTIVHSAYPDVKKKLLNWRTKSELTKNEDVLTEFIAPNEVKKTINLIIDQLINPERYQQKNIKLIRGCLLYGKPGNGKTLLARCLSKLRGITFINTCASEYVELYVGSGPKKVREIFQLARENKPAIIFIDELESIGVHRSTNSQTYSLNTERYSTLNQLLAEMDGIIDNDNIAVIAATNREDLLDAALVRPGRFSVKIQLTAPDKQRRAELFKLYLSKYNFDSESITDQVINELSEKSDLMSAATIEGIVNDAASLVISNEENMITLSHLEDSFRKNSSEFLKFKKFEEKNSIY